MKRESWVKMTPLVLSVEDTTTFPVLVVSRHISVTLCKVIDRACLYRTQSKTWSLQLIWERWDSDFLTHANMESG